MEVTRGEIDGITENNLRTILTRLEQDYAADKEERLRQERLSHEETMKALAASEREKAETARREQTLMEQGVVHKEELTKLRDFEADATSRKRKKSARISLFAERSARIVFIIAGLVFAAIGVLALFSHLSAWLGVPAAIVGFFHLWCGFTGIKSSRSSGSGSQHVSSIL